MGPKLPPTGPSAIVWVLAGFFGDRFSSKSYFHAQSGAEQPPKVKF